MWTYWYVREASTAFFVANIPNCWSLVRKLFHLRSWNGSSGRTGSNHGYGLGTGTALQSRTRKTGTSGLTSGLYGRSVKLPSEVGAEDGWETKDGRNSKLGTGLGKSESEEHITGSQTSMAKAGGLQIWQDVHFDVVDDRRSVLGDGEADSREQMYNGLEKGGEDFKTKTTVTANELRE